MLSRSLALLVLLFNFAAHASVRPKAIGDDCVYRQQISLNTVANLYFTTGRGCLVQITPLNKPELVYRDYLIDQRGSFQIFDSTTGPYETSTGTRGFFFFPRRQAPSFAVLPDGNIDVTLSSLNHLTIAAATARLQAFNGASFTENPTVAITDLGGVEFSTFDGLWLDTGWQIGGAALAHPDRTSVFHDAHGVSCEVKNSEIVEGSSDEVSEPLFIAQTDPELAAFLAKRCPQLDIQSLNWAGATGH